MDNFSNTSNSSINTNKFKLDSNLLKHRIPYREKNKDWREAMVDSIISRASLNINSGSSYIDNICTNIVDGIIDRGHISKVMNLFNSDEFSLLGDKELVNFNIIKSKVNGLVGEQQQRTFQPVVTSSNPSYYKELNSKREELGRQAAEALITNKLIAKGVMQPTEESEEAIANTIPIDQIDSYLTDTFKDKTEIKGQETLNVITKLNDLKYITDEGFKKSICTNKEVYALINNNNEPEIKLLDSNNFWCNLPKSKDIVAESDCCVYLDNMTYGAVIDEFHDFFGDDLKLKHDLDVYNYLTGNKTTANNFPNIVDTTFTGNFNSTTANTAFGMNTQKTQLIPVWRVSFYSERKVGKVKFINDLGLIEILEVDEDSDVVNSPVYDETKNLIDGMEVKWVWINERWDGIRIGTNLYPKVERYIHFGTADNISRCKLPYAGIFSNKPSLVSDMLDLQYLYIVAMLKLQDLIKTDDGKVLLFDISQIPDKKGWDTKSWLKYMKKAKIAFVDPQSQAYQGTGRAGSNVHSFNTFQVLDMSNMGNIQSLVQVLDAIDRWLESVTGITRGRQGDIRSTDTVGGIERSLIQSTAITRFLFIRHGKALKDLCQQALDLGRECWKNGKFVVYFDEKVGKTSFQLDSLELSSASLDVWASFDETDVTNLVELKNTAKGLMNTGKELFGDLAGVVLSTSISEVKGTIAKVEKRAEDKVKTEQEANQKAVDSKNQNDAAIAQQQAEQFAQATKDKLDLDKYKIDEANKTAILVAQINAEKRATSGTSQDNTEKFGEEDIIEKLKQQIELAKHQLEIDKLELDKKIRESELKIKAKAQTLAEKTQKDNVILKEKEIASKKAIASEKTVKSN